MSLLYLNHSIKAAKPQYFFTIHYYFLLSKNPECEFSEEWKVNSEKVKTRTLSHSGFLEVPIGFEPMNKGFADLGLTTWLWHHIRKGIFNIRLFSKQMVPWGGIEPPTRGFSVPCSTDWATKAYLEPFSSYFQQLLLP